MLNPQPFKTIVLFLSLIALVIILSMISTKLWGGKPETLPDPGELKISEDMTLKDFGQANGLANPALKQIFELQTRSDLEKKLVEYGTADQIKSLVIKKLALAAEHESKNWLKILIKFCLWFAFLIAVFIFFRGRKANSTIRNTALFISVLIFGVIFVGILLILSLFIYRPWCHLFCPFGLVGWLVEKASRISISVDYETCIACQKCATACPSTVMGAILKQDKKTIPDCFACYTCRDVCPTESIRFSTRKRTFPPPGHFEQKPKLGSPEV